MFGANDWIRIRVILQGMPKYVAQMYEGGRANMKFAASQDAAAIATQRLTKSTFLQNQATFTGRRLLFYSTLGVLGMGAALVKLGFNYESTMQQARVALAPVITDHVQLSKTLNDLFILAATTPFHMQEATAAFRQLFLPFKLAGQGKPMVLQTLTATMDALAQSGNLTEGSLKRATTQLQHMLYLGRPTGQVLLALARDGLPVWAALRKELGLTDQQMHNISRTGVDSVTVIKALNRFIETTPGYKGMAFIQQTKTLSGAWNTFIDLLSQASGKAERGPFGRIQGILQGVDKSMTKIYQKGRPVTLTNLADAFDKQLSPKTHIVINTFILLEYTLKGLIGTFWLLFKTLQIILIPFDYLISALGGSKTAMKLLGIWIGISLGLWAAWRTAVLLGAVATDIASISMAGLRKAILLLMGTEGLAGLTGVAGGLGKALFRSGTLMETLALRTLLLWDIVKAKGLIGSLRLFVAWIWGSVPALWAAAQASWSFTMSLLANPITWLVIAVIALYAGLVILYYKWKPFHNLVNETWQFLKKNWFWARMFVNAFAPIVGLVGDVRQLYIWLKKIYDLIRHPIKTATGGGWLGLLDQAYKHTIGGYMMIPGMPKEADPFYWAKHRAAGGYSSGWTMVGERGPELLRLPASSRVFAGGAVPSQLNGGLIIRVYPQAIYFDKRKIGEIVAGVVTDREARL